MRTTDKQQLLDLIADQRKQIADLMVINRMAMRLMMSDGLVPKEARRAALKESPEIDHEIVGIVEQVWRAKQDSDVQWLHVKLAAWGAMGVGAGLVGALIALQFAHYLWG